MSTTPIQRLAGALKAFKPAEYAALGARAGVNTRAVQRAAMGVQIRADHYLKLCAAIGIDSITGDPVPIRRLGDLDWKLLGLGVELTRRIRKVLTLRKVADRIGKRVSISMLSRIENGQPVSISGVIAICQFIGTSPEQYTADPSAEKFHGKPKTATREMVTA